VALEEAVLAAAEVWGVLQRAPRELPQARLRKSVLASFRKGSPGEQLRVRRQCVDVMRYPDEYDRGLAELCAILKVSKVGR
jgi:hypothetical protein